MGSNKICYVSETGSVSASWRWRQYVSSKRWYIPATPHGVTTQTTSMKSLPPWESQISYSISSFIFFSSEYESMNHDHKDRMSINCFSGSLPRSYRGVNSPVNTSLASANMYRGCLPECKQLCFGILSDIARVEIRDHEDDCLLGCCAV
jgi:hypothetical protein